MSQKLYDPGIRNRVVSVGGKYMLLSFAGFKFDLFLPPQGTRTRTYLNNIRSTTQSEGVRLVGALEVRSSS